MQPHDAGGEYWETRGLVLLWTATLIGPAAAAINLQAGYALVKWSCASQQAWVLMAIAAVSCALALCGAWLGWRCLRMTGSGEALAGDDAGGNRVDRSAFMALVAIGLNLLLAIFIAASLLPMLVLSPCE